MSNKRVHIIKRGDGWALKKEEASRASKIYEEKSAATKAAQDYREKGYDVIIHKKNGLVENWQKAK